MSWDWLKIINHMNKRLQYIMPEIGPALFEVYRIFVYVVQGIKVTKEDLTKGEVPPDPE